VRGKEGEGEGTRREDKKVLPHIRQAVATSASALLGYTVPLTSVHAGKYRTEDKLKTDTSTLQELNTTQKKQTTQNTAKQN